jgi:hypothetical protein
MSCLALSLLDAPPIVVMDESITGVHAQGSDLPCPVLIDDSKPSHRE